MPASARPSLAPLRDPVLRLLYLLAFLLMGAFVTLYNYAGFRLLALPYGLSQAAVSAVFLLYLHRATGEARFGHAARRALAFEVAQLAPREDGGIWLPGRVGSTTFEPYWEYGGAGLGSALARFCAVTGDERLRAKTDLLARSIVGGIAVNAGLHLGLRKLKPLDRETLEAFYLRGRSLKQMSLEFDVPTGTIKRRLHVARQRLKDVLDDGGHPSREDREAGLAV